MVRMPTCGIVAGPNGGGKTTFALFDGACDGIEKDDAIKMKQNQCFTMPIDD
jgi:predicted ABC-type ATPase